MLDTLNLWVATGLGLGQLPVAPGTFGSLLGIPLAWWLLGRPVGQQAAFIFALLVLAVPVCDLASLHFIDTDHGSIVADEYAAFPLAVLGLHAARQPLVMALAFAVYRFFDSLKPPPIHLAELVDGGLGVVLDDVLAAGVTWVVVAFGLFIWRRYQPRNR
ncbi:MULTISPECIES: phosphatidylglycerophosphatase A family protein [unclassified Halomonas]|uniref:phosphatidylglycerophosphatase A family protein n=1 Tax=unclassified Halomonas TaxID=2609666 RepID=UPI0006D9CA92|nr:MULTISPECIES: phosphatidylglycerophosphatase A [unclassified Halomonas]KPQ21278.1 MAG: phosphatidylglycerophosphatase A-related protein [Halomonas sp. HL-93]SBR50733.1 phosphatidylglycerophosphatase [Halomonas sp. HL-93]SNY97007.1 phosphatidylglycerophosphatase [Halomonas sp. hl-4]